MQKPTTETIINDTTNNIGFLAEYGLANPYKFLRMVLNSKTLFAKPKLFEQAGFKIISNLDGVKQNPDHHPEGCVFTHTSIVVAHMQEICNREGFPKIVKDSPSGGYGKRNILLLAALFHDVGKARPENGGTTCLSRGRWQHKGHDKIGARMVGTLLTYLKFPKAVVSILVHLVREHMFLIDFDIRHKELSKTRIIKRLINRIAQDKLIFDMLMLLVEADTMGRRDIAEELKEVKSIAAKVFLEIEELKNKPPRLMNGQILIDKLHLVPSPLFRQIIDACSIAQDNGTIKTEEEALALANEMLDQFEQPTGKV